MKAKTIETGVLVIGGGSAGCHAALRARQLGARAQMGSREKWDAAARPHHPRYRAVVSI